MPGPSEKLVGLCSQTGKTSSPWAKPDLFLMNKEMSAGVAVGRHVAKM